MRDKERVDTKRKRGVGGGDTEPDGERTGKERGGGGFD